MTERIEHDADFPVLGARHRPPIVVNRRTRQ